MDKDNIRDRERMTVTTENPGAEGDCDVQLGDCFLYTPESKSKIIEEIQPPLLTPPPENEIKEKEKRNRSRSCPKYPEIRAQYQLHDTIGHGGFSKVKMATDLSTGKVVAIKIVDKKQVGSELPRIDLEIDIQEIIHHPHICKLFSVLNGPHHIYMVLEYCPTDLYEYIVGQENRIPLFESRKIFIQLMAAVDYLHSIGIAHRDLKPENVLLDYLGNVKLTDFGLCAVPGKAGIGKPGLKTLCGSPAYCSPELLKNAPYVGSKVDVWSLGVLLFVLLAGQLPFYAPNVKDLYKKILEGVYTPPPWMSSRAKELIGLLLQPNPSLRPSLHRLWNHPWILEAEIEDQEILEPFQKQIRTKSEGPVTASRSGMFFVWNTRLYAEHDEEQNVSEPKIEPADVVPYIETDTGTKEVTKSKSQASSQIGRSSIFYPNGARQKVKVVLRIPKWIRNGLKKLVNCFPNCGKNKSQREKLWDYNKF